MNLKSVGNFGRNPVGFGLGKNLMDWRCKMDSFELNKIAGAILFSLLIVMGLGMISNFIFSTDSPVKMGYEIDVAEAAQDESAGEEESSVESIATRLTGADVAAGEKVAKKCVACHTFDSGGANKVGPNLWSVINRTPAAVSGFKYSGSMTEFASSAVWDFETLDRYLEKPKDVVPGTSMSFAGLRKPKDRADLILYLNSKSDQPVPLPTEGAEASQ